MSTRSEQKRIAADRQLRLLGSRVPYAVSGTAHITVGIVSGHKHNDMGTYPWLPCCVYNIRGPGHCSDFAGYI